LRREALGRVHGSDCVLIDRSELTARAGDVLTVLRVRGLSVPDAARERILAETDPARLQRWIERAVVAASVAELIDDPS
jgi:hypothetical protein